ncbi:MAG: RNA polymerase sigma factor [Candidatus Aminicenantia bacterium]
MKMDEQDLVLRLQQGDEMAFVKIVNSYKDKIVNYLYHLTGDYQRAVELSQETFLRVYFKARKYKPIAPFSSWVYTIASNLAKTELKKMSKIKTIPLDELKRNPEIESTSIDFRKKEKIARVKKALDSLPPKYKIPIILKDIEGFTQEEIAKMLKAPIGTIKARISRGRNILKNELERGEIYSEEKKGG